MLKAIIQYFPQKVPNRFTGNGFETTFLYLLNIERCYKSPLSDIEFRSKFSFVLAILSLGLTQKLLDIIKEPNIETLACSNGMKNGFIHIAENLDGSIPWTQDSQLKKPQENSSVYTYLQDPGTKPPWLTSAVSKEEKTPRRQ